MPITEYREAYKGTHGFEYPIYFEIYKKVMSSIWRPEEVNLTSDLSDWKMITQDERDIIAGILRGFTLFECHVSEYWGDKVCKIFPKHEIVALSRAFSLFEINHSHAYNYLSETLGLNEFEEFLGDPTARKKLADFQRFQGDLVSLAIFSGAGEGVSLFSSFAVLLSFNYFSGRFKGLQEIISWSALDEQMHSHVGCMLFKELVKEKGITAEEKKTIIEGFDLIVANEFAFIDNIFQGRSLPHITPEQLRNYILYRANDRLITLGLADGDYYSYDMPSAKAVKDWFEPLISGNSSNDFFTQAKDGGNYIAKPDLDFDSINVGELLAELCI